MLKAPYVKKWGRDPSDAQRRRGIIAKGLSYGAFAGDRMVGALVMERRTWNNTLHVEDLEVMPDWRWRGVGRMLMARAEVVARELGGTGHHPGGAEYQCPGHTLLPKERIRDRLRGPVALYQPRRRGRRGGPDHEKEA